MNIIGLYIVQFYRISDYFRYEANLNLHYDLTASNCTAINAAHCLCKIVMARAFP